MTDRSDIARFVEDLVATEQVTAAVAWVQSGDREVLSAAAGALDPGERRLPVGTDARFDLASITKSFSGALALVLHQTGELSLQTELGAVWSSVDDRLARVTLEDLLRHRAGFRRWMPLYAVCSTTDEVAGRLLDGEWLDAPEPVYSDLDYLLWGLSVERALGVRWTELVRQRVQSVLGMEAFAERSPAVGCLLPTGREVELAASVGLRIGLQPAPDIGEPQDGNCRFLGRALGHAGLFGSAAGVAALGLEFLRPGTLVDAGAAATALGGADRYALGWFRQGETAAGRVLGERAFGHEGFTGGSLWVDPDADLVTVLLAHRATLAVDLSEARARLHRLALDL